MSQIVSLRNQQWKCLQPLLTRGEWYIILNSAGTYLSNQFVDVIGALFLLKRHGFIKEGVFIKLKEKFNKTDGTPLERTRVLLFEIACLMNFVDIAKFLWDIGLKEFAKDIWEKRYGQTIIFRAETDTGVSLNTLLFYNKLKANMDNRVFGNRREALHDLSNQLRQLIRVESNVRIKQELVNRFASVTYQLAALYRGREREQILNQMVDDTPRDVNLTLVLLVYDCKMAVTAIHRGDTEEATRFIARVHELCNVPFTEESRWIKALLWHDQQYISRCRDSRTPSDEHLKNTCVEGQVGLDIMYTYPKDQSHIMVKIFKTEMVMGLLNITNDFAVDVSIPLSKDDKRRAKEMLQTLVGCQRTLETRREMIVCLCQARLCEEDDLEEAKAYAGRACHLAPQGAHFPLQVENIQQYSRYLNDKTPRKCVTW